MRTSLIAIAAAKLFQAPGNVPARGAGVESYVLQPAGPAYVADGAYVQYAQASPYAAIPAQVPMGSASPSSLSSSTVLLFGAAVGAAVAALGVGGERLRGKGTRRTMGTGRKIVQVGRSNRRYRAAQKTAESDDEMPTPGRLVSERAGMALENEMKNAGLPMPSVAFKPDAENPFIDYNKTHHPGHDAIQMKEKKWLVVDAEGMRLGRLCTEIARRLIGKHKVNFYPGADVGDVVVVVNAEKVCVSGKKPDHKLYRRHSGRPGGMKVETFKELQARIPERIIEKAVWGMLPKNAFGRELFRHLKVYKGPTHPHAAQKPVEMEWPYKEEALKPIVKRDRVINRLRPDPLVATQEELEAAAAEGIGPLAAVCVLGTEVDTKVAALGVGGTEFSLTNLAPKPGSKHRKMRKGRGISAGKGKTCGYGNDGQKARSGRSVHYSKQADGTKSKFAGGQNEYFQGSSRKDHNRPHGPGHTYTRYSLIKLSDLNKLEDGSEVTFADMVERKLVHKSSKAVGVRKAGKSALRKVVGGAELTAKNLTVKSHAFTESAKSAIEANGGTVVILNKHNKEISSAEQTSQVVAALGMLGWGIRGERVTKYTSAKRKRQLRVRKKVIGTEERPRLCVHRTNNHMYAQIINDRSQDKFGNWSGHILCGASTMTPEIRTTLEGKGGNKESAFKVGELIASRAKALGVEKVCFDRAGYLYHGRIAAVAEGARAGGLDF